jgi:hypothetical protein
MKLTAYHDDNGNLVALSARPDNAPRSRIETRPPLTISEIDAPDLPDDADPDVVQDRLSTIVTDKRVEVVNGVAQFSDRLHHS